MPGTTSAATTEPAGRVALVTGAGSGIPNGARAQLAALSPFGTVAQPQEVAGVVVSLCEEAAARVSGNVIRMR